VRDGRALRLKGFRVSLIILKVGRKTRLMNVPQRGKKMLGILMFGSILMNDGDET
jgi:hypothetical protein